MCSLLVRVCFFPADFSGCGYYRCLFPAQQLAKNGHRVFLPKHEVERREDATLYHRKLDLVDVENPSADVYVFQHPREESHPLVIRELRANGAVVVGEIDDLDFDMPSWHAARNALAPLRSNRWHWQHLKRSLALCDAVTTPTDFLTGYAKKHVNAVARTLPNLLHWPMWEHVTPVYQEKGWRKVRVGWMGAWKLRPGDLEVLDWLPGWLEKNPGVEFVTVGSPGSVLNIPVEQRVDVGRVVFGSMRLPEIVPTMDIGLVPLANVPFNHAKSALKGMEYNACGIPCVASPSPEYQKWVEPGVNGFLAATPEEWMAALDTLVNDEELRREMGRKARKKAAEHTYDKKGCVWEEFYADCLDTHAHHTRTRSIPRGVQAVGSGPNRATRRASSRARR